jgi:hypothetical protein
LFILSLIEGDFQAVCKAHFKKIREQRPSFGSSSNRGIIDEFAPEKVAACKDILWHSIPEHCQWIVSFGLATSLYLRTEELAKLTWSQVVLGNEKHIFGLIDGRTVHITNIFNKTHKLTQQNPTAQRYLRETKHDAVEDINNPNCFVKAIQERLCNSSTLQKRVFTLKTCKKEKPSPCPRIEILLPRSSFHQSNWDQIGERVS